MYLVQADGVKSWTKNCTVFGRREVLRTKPCRAGQGALRLLTRTKGRLMEKVKDRIYI